MSDGKKRRRIYWVNPKSQGAYVLRILLLEIAVAVLCVLLTAFVTVFYLKFNSGPGFAGAESYWARIYGYTLICCTLAGAMLIYLGIRISHRTYGPVYRYEQVFRELTELGRIPPEIILRKHDEFQYLNQYINKYFDQQRRKDSQVRQSIAESLNQLKELEQDVRTISNGNARNSQSRIEQIKQQLKQIGGQAR